MTAADPTTERLERLLAEHGAAVARVAASYERDRGRQQDLVQEIAVALWRALPDLPFGQRQVLVLALEGLSHREIGEVLGLRENAVAVRLNRARQALRARLAAEETRR